MEVPDTLVEAMESVSISHHKINREELAQSLFRLEYFLRDGWENSPIDNLSGILIEMSNGTAGLTDWLSPQAAGCNIDALRRYAMPGVQVSGPEEEQMRQCAVQCAACVTALAELFTDLSKCLT